MHVSDRNYFEISLIGALVCLAVVAVVLATMSLNYQVNNSIVVERLAQAVKQSRGSDGAYPTNIEELYSDSDRNVLYVTNGRHFVLVTVGRWWRPKPGFERWLANDVGLNARSNCLSPWADTIFSDRGPVLYCLK